MGVVGGLSPKRDRVISLEVLEAPNDEMDRACRDGFMGKQVLEVAGGSTGRVCLCRQQSKSLR